jgi:hypothetical protein
LLLRLGGSIAARVIWSIIALRPALTGRAPTLPARQPIGGMTVRPLAA